MQLTSFKLRFVDTHVRIVPATDTQGCPFGGPGVDLRGEEASAVLRAAEPLVEWVRARDPACTVRGISVALDIGRVLFSLDDPHGIRGGKPQALRVDAPDSDELLELAKALVPMLSHAAQQALMRRRDPMPR
jgi:hypothetical protein